MEKLRKDLDAKKKIAKERREPSFSGDPFDDDSDSDDDERETIKESQILKSLICKRFSRKNADLGIDIMGQLKEKAYDNEGQELLDLIKRKGYEKVDSNKTINQEVRELLPLIHAHYCLEVV